MNVILGLLLLVISYELGKYMGYRDVDQMLKGEVMTTSVTHSTPAKRGRGGPRPGAGRPPVNDQPMACTSILVEQEQLAALDRWCAAHGTHRSQALRWAIDILVRPPRSES